MHLSQPLVFNLCVYVCECAAYVCSVSMGACKQAHTLRPEGIRCPAVSLHLISLRQCLSVSLKLGWCSANLTEPPVSTPQN